MDPKLIIINSTYGGGKSLIKKNLSKYFSFYEEDKYIHIDFDEFLMSIPSYKSAITKISEYLKTNILNKKLNTYGIADLNKFDNLTIAELIITKSFNKLSVNNYKQLYEYIENIQFGKIGTTIKQFSQNLFDKYKEYGFKMLDNIVEICKYMKYNMVIEIGMLKYDKFNKLINNEIKHDNWYYIGYNYNPNTQQFILKNVLKRNIETGRLLNYNMVINTFNNIQPIIDSYKVKIPKYNLILIEQGYVMSNIMSLSNNQISKKMLTSEVKFNEKFDSRCGSATPFNLTNSFGTFKTNCILKNSQSNPGIQNIKKPADIGTDSNTKYLFDENTSALIILNTFDQLQQSIKQIIGYYNTLPDIPHKLVETDIKVVLKGGLNIRLYLKKLIVFIEKTIEDKKISNTHSLNQSRQIIKLLDFFKDFERNNPNNIFEKIISKSDLDFTIVMNKSKFNKEKYDLVKKLIFAYCIDYLQRLKKVLTDTDFFGAESILKLNLKNIYTENSDRINTIEYNEIKYDGNTDKIENISPNTIYNNVFQYLASDLHFNDKTNLTEDTKRYKLIPNRINELTTIPSPDIMKDLNRFVISYSNNINSKSLLFNDTTEKFENSINAFDLARIQNGYIINNRHLFGEIIDIAIVSFDTLQQTQFDNIETLNYSNNHYDFDINIFNLKYLAHDLEIVLFEQRIFPWEDKKYMKRINRYIIIKIFEEIIKSTLFYKVCYVLHSSIQI
jgi:hypothetical protein